MNSFVFHGRLIFIHFFFLCIYNYYWHLRTFVLLVFLFYCKHILWYFGGRRFDARLKMTNDQNAVKERKSRILCNSVIFLLIQIRFEECKKQFRIPKTEFTFLFIFEVVLKRLLKQAIVCWSCQNMLEK